MQVTTIDTDMLEWSLLDFQTDLRPGPEAAMQYLCELQDEDDEASLVGPVSFTTLEDCFLLIAAWTCGRQWFKMLLLFSDAEISDERRVKICEQFLPEALEAPVEEE